MRESAVETHIRLDAAKLGIELWRNNVGMAWHGEVTHLKDGSIHIRNPRPVRYGICNESKQMNEVVKSSDWLGITPEMVMPHHVGEIWGIFTALEAKPTNFKFNSSDKHLLAQKNFHDIVRKAGGRAGFAHSINSFREIVRR